MTEFSERFSRILEQSIYGDFILGIIHNLSTPLSGILGGAQLLEMRMKNWSELIKVLPESNPEIMDKIKKDHEKNMANVELIIRNARNLSELISNMVQAQNKSAVEEIEVINLGEFLRQVFKFLEGDMVFKHQVKKEYHAPEQVPPLRFIYNHVAQLIIEWIRRCLPALEMQESPHLDIHIDSTANKVELSLILNVPLVEADPLETPSEGLVPLARGLRLPLAFYIDRIQVGNVSADVTTAVSETTLRIIFPR
jgi:signal transduction histidine kinase